MERTRSTFSSRDSFSQRSFVTLVYPSVPYRRPDGDTLPSNDTAEVLAVEADLGETTLTIDYIPPPSSFPRITPPTLPPFWRIDHRWCLATLTPSIRPGSPKQEMIGQRLEGMRFMGRSTVCSSLLRTKTSLLSSRPRSSPPRQI